MTGSACRARIRRTHARAARDHSQGLVGRRFTHKGRFYSYENLEVWPRPEQRPHPPIWLRARGRRRASNGRGRWAIAFSPWPIPASRTSSPTTRSTARPGPRPAIPRGWRIATHYHCVLQREQARGARHRARGPGTATTRRPPTRATGSGRTSPFATHPPAADRRGHPGYRQDGRGIPRLRVHARRGGHLFWSGRRMRWGSPSATAPSFSAALPTIRRSAPSPLRERGHAQTEAPGTADCDVVSPPPPPPSVVPARRCRDPRCLGRQSISPSEMTATSSEISYTCRNAPAIASPSFATVSGERLPRSAGSSR